MRKVVLIVSAVGLVAGIARLASPDATLMLRQIKILIKGAPSTETGYLIDGAAYVPLRLVQKLYDTTAISDPNSINLLPPEKPVETHGGESSGSSSSPREAAIETECFQLQNEFREANQLEPLEFDAGLQLMARVHSDDMMRRKFFSHNNPDGNGPGERKEKYYRQLAGGVGENIFTMSGSYLTKSPSEIAKMVEDGWENSPPHRENMLRPEFTHAAIGVVVSGDKLMATCNFSPEAAVLDRPVPSLLTPNSKLTVTGEVRGKVSLATFGAYLGIPDPNARCAVPDKTNYYSLGGCFLKVQPIGARRFQISLDLNKGQGVYELQLGESRDGKHSFYPGWKIMVQ